MAAIKRTNPGFPYWEDCVKVGKTDDNCQIFVPEPGMMLSGKEKKTGFRLPDGIAARLRFRRVRRKQDGRVIRR
jgi:hypothetical protein